MLPIFYGILSALTWGAADFCGGLASRKANANQVVVFSELTGLLAILVLAPIFGAQAPPWSDLIWSAAAGALGCTGLVILFKAFSDGQMSTTAPVSALAAAALPLLVGLVLEGLPGLLTIGGFLLALIAIWFIPQDSDERPFTRLADLRLPLLSGIFFGLYFILMDRGTQTTILWPMVASRFGGSLVITLYMLVRRLPLLPGQAAWPLILLNAALDVGGNAFFILAARLGRMDVAAVISSLYPGMTVFLAWLVLKERLGRRQLVGVLAAIGAITLMTLPG
ncbi:MAG: DMT family transporter [Anaerolineales bacterium]|nr:DMT family transporter [Anaerolineales bacterium]